MRILVMGAGAVGGYFGGALLKAGRDVAFIARGAQLEAIRSKGIEVDSETIGRFAVRGEAFASLDGGWQADLVLFCVKAYHNADAVNLIAPAVGAGTTILTLQNGISAGDQLAAAFGKGKVLLGAAYIEAARPAPGVAKQIGACPRIVFGEPDGSITHRGRAIQEALSVPGIDAAFTDEIYRALWHKLIFICALSGMTCVTRSPFAEVIDIPETRELALRIMQEANAVALASGVATDPEIVADTMAEFVKHKNDLVSSMHADLLAGNPLELDAINGAVSSRGRSLGVATPVNDFVTACLSLADRRARGRSV